MLEIKTFYCNPFRECTYIVSAQPSSDKEQPCIIIDPGMYEEKEERRVLDYLTAHKLNPVAMLITHTHPDHICGRECIEEHFLNIPVYGFNYTCEPEDSFVEVADLRFRMLPTPGHKEDSVCFYFESEGIIFTGDTLFQESIGRTDFPGGDMNVLLQSLARLKQLPKETVVYPGHGFTTTIEHELRYNPYL